MKFKYILIFSILLTVFVAGCVEESKADSGRFTSTSYRVDEDSIKILHDNENNVTVYVYHDQFHGGTSISAIPDWQLKEPTNYTKV